MSPRRAISNVLTMRPSGESGPRVISGEQSRRLLDVRRRMTSSLPPRELLRQLCMRMADIVDAKVAVLGRRDHRWVVLAESSEMPRLFGPANEAPDTFDEIAVRLQRGVAQWRHDNADWTLVGLAPLPEASGILVLEGDWMQSASVLRDMVQSLLCGPSQNAPRMSISDAAHNLARELTGITGISQVSELVLRHVVQAVPCRLATFAVPTERGDLAIVATYGHPLALTSHLRIAPGVGVIGTVYQTAAPMLVADVTTVRGAAGRRHRYRTDSFAALPIMAGPDVLGVLCVTDREGDRPFSSEDVSNLEVMIAPVALALARERAERQAHLYAQAAIVDPTSGLFNRPYFQSRLEEELQRSSRHATPVSLLMIDIDAFKTINDTFGHIAGDTVIRDVSDILRRSVRLFDVCARYGGEEFAVLMPGSGIESATAIAERIRRRIHAYHSTDHGLANLRVTVSIGVAESRRGAAAREMIERADNALYAAKRAGKNRVSTSDQVGG
jgi:diguanylate cyclase (GGDEF)-like protein